MNEKINDAVGNYSAETEIKIVDAISILGRNNVVTVANVLCQAEIARHENKDALISVGYERAELESAADANRKGLANWFLVYCSGKSPRWILEKRFDSLFGFGESERFDKNQWFFRNGESFWAGKEYPAGYYLLNFGGETENDREIRFEGMTFLNQEEAIKKLSNKERAPFGIVLEAVFSVYDAHKILLLEHWNHLSGQRDQSGSLLYLGGTGSKASGEKMINVFEFPKGHETNPKNYYGFGAVLLSRRKN